MDYGSFDIATIVHKNYYFQRKQLVYSYEIRINYQS